MGGKKTVDIEQIFQQTILEAIPTLNKHTINMKQKSIPTLLGGFAPPTFRLTAERTNRLRHKSYYTYLHCTAIQTVDTEQTNSG